MLIAGGSNADGVLASKEIFDPETLLLSRGPSMGSARRGPLPDRHSLASLHSGAHRQPQDLRQGGPAASETCYSSGVGGADESDARSVSAPITLILVDDHPVVLSGLEHLLRDSAGFDILDRCTSGSEAVTSTRQHRPDVLVLDLHMPGVDGLGVARELHDAGELPATVLLTAQLGEDEFLEALHLGIRGFVLKEMTTSLLVQCVRRVHSGGQWLEKDAASRAMAKLVRREAKGQEIAALLTRREIEVVRMVAKGLTNKEIASELCIAAGTVKIHLQNIYEKVKIGRRVELVRFAQQYELI